LITKARLFRVISNNELAGGTIMTKNKSEIKIADLIDEDLYEEFNKHIFGVFLKFNDSMSTILRGHLYIESEFEKQFRTFLENPEVLDMDRMKFSDKLTWLVAFGLMSKENRMPYKLLNDLRNKFAHNIEYQLRDIDLEKIVNTFSKSQRDRYRKMVNDQTNNDTKLRFCLSILWIDICLVTELIQMKKENERLKKQLDNERELNNLNSEANRKHFEQWLKIKTTEPSIGT
jgi:hypothetical protein